MTSIGITKVALSVRPGVNKQITVVRVGCAIGMQDIAPILHRLGNATPLIERLGVFYVSFKCCRVVDRRVNDKSRTQCVISCIVNIVPVIDTCDGYPDIDSIAIPTRRAPVSFIQKKQLLTDFFCSW